MSEIHATVTIEAPVERVLQLIDDPANLATCAPLVERVVVVAKSGRRVGDSFRASCRVLGMPFDEEFSVVGFEPPRRHTPHRRFQMWQTFQGRATGTLTWTLEAEGNQTYASLDAAYRLTGGALGRALGALVVEGAVKKGVDQMLENMRQVLAPPAMLTE